MAETPPPASGRLGIFHQQSALHLAIFVARDARATEKQRYFSFGTPRALISVRTRRSGSVQQCKGVFDMFSSSIRETATVFAGALVTALLLVSAATSLPIA
jgi:hypothetical protein